MIAAAHMDKTPDKTNDKKTGKNKQPQFSRMSLNVLMLISTVLIVILYVPKNKEEMVTLPTAPSLNSQSWLSDSGAQIWFSPYLTDRLEIQLWYKAGYRYDGEQKGTAHLLAQLLKYESRKRQLPMEVSLDQDFIKVSLHLSKAPLAMRKTLQDASALLYHPKLATTLLNTLRQSPVALSPPLSSHLLQKVYGQHSYAGPKTGTQSSLANISRQQLQVFQQQFLNPKRLHASIVGDISEAGAQLIMETLLPVSRHQSAKKVTHQPHSSNHVSENNMAVLVWPGLNSLQTPNQHKQLINTYLLTHILKMQHPQHIKLRPGKLNNTLYINDSKQLQISLQEIQDSAMMARAKRQLATRWLEQVQNADKLSRYLVRLNAYGLPVNQMNKNLQYLQAISFNRWQKDTAKLLEPLAFNDQ